jgi:hypothetical protein
MASEVEDCSTMPAAVDSNGSIESPTAISCNIRSVDAEGREFEALFARPADLSREVDRRAHPDHEDDLGFGRDPPSGVV